MMRAQDRMSRLPETIMPGISLLIVLAMVLFSYRSGQDAQRAGPQRQISRNIAGLNAELLSALKDAEIGQRDFLITGRDEYLQSYNLCRI
jgi:CHASE3 domain sensor protein